METTPSSFYSLEDNEEPKRQRLDSFSSCSEYSVIVLDEANESQKQSSSIDEANPVPDLVYVENTLTKIIKSFPNGVESSSKDALEKAASLITSACVNINEANTMSSYDSASDTDSDSESEEEETEPPYYENTEFHNKVREEFAKSNTKTNTMVEELFKTQLQQNNSNDKMNDDDVPVVNEAVDDSTTSHISNPAEIPNETELSKERLIHLTNLESALDACEELLATGLITKITESQGLQINTNKNLEIPNEASSTDNQSKIDDSLNYEEISETINQYLSSFASREYYINDQLYQYTRIITSLQELVAAQNNLSKQDLEYHMSVFNSVVKKFIENLSVDDKKVNEETALRIQKSLGRMNADRNNMLDKLSTLERQLEEISKNSTDNEEILKCKKDLDEAVAANVHLKGEIEKLQEEKKNFEAEIKKQNEIISNHGMTLSTWGDCINSLYKLKTASEEVSNVEKITREQLNTLKKENELLKSQDKDICTSALLSKISKLEKVHKMMSLQLENMKLKNEVLQSEKEQHLQIIAALDNCDKNCDPILQDQTVLMEEIEIQKKELINMKDQYEKVKKDYLSSQELIRELREKNTEFENLYNKGPNPWIVENNRLKSTLNSMKNDLSILEQQLLQNQEMVKKLTEKNTELQNKNQKPLQENEGLKLELSHLKEAFHNLNMLLHSSQEVIKELRAKNPESENKKLMGENADLRLELSNLKEAFQNLNLLLQSSQEAIKELRNKNTELENKVTELQHYKAQCDEHEHVALQMIENESRYLHLIDELSNQLDKIETKN